MTATRLLKQQHQEIKELLMRISRSTSAQTQLELFREAAARILAHDAIEREIFYPACEEAMGMTRVLGEALLDHGVIEFSMYQANQARDQKDFCYKCRLLTETLEHHMKEEEQQLFPLADETLSKERLEGLAATMKSRFTDAVTSDFPSPLHENLKQILSEGTPARVYSASQGP